MPAATHILELIMSQNGYVHSAPHILTLLPHFIMICALRLPVLPCVKCHITAVSCLPSATFESGHGRESCAMEIGRHYKSQLVLFLES